MTSYKIDLPVLLIFFARPEQFRETFAAVKSARPSKLFLYQDGPRQGAKYESDIKGIMECRSIADDVDWECDVHKLYQETNVGCDPSEYIAQKWAFEYVDRCVVLEDDDVADQTFFPYCKELLERYIDDERVAMICGTNHLGHWSPEGYSYFFSNTGPICGWATWKRIVDEWDPEYSSLDNANVVKLMSNNYKEIALDQHIGDMVKHKKDGRAFYETILGLSRFTQNRLCILPEYNLIHNIGYGAGATHTSNKSWINMIPLGSLSLPLRHPRYMVNDSNYSRVYLRLARGPKRWSLDWFVFRLKKIIDLFK